MTERVPPVSLTATLATDVPAHVVAWLLLVMVGVTAGMFAYSVATGWQPSDPWTVVFFQAAGPTILGVIALIYRARRIDRILREGTAVEARLTGFATYSQWVRLGLAYAWEGETIERRVWLPHTARTRRLAHRDAVTVLLRPDHPRSAVVRDLFVEQTT